MEWNIIIYDKDGYVEIITSGVADRDGSLNMAKALQNSMRTHQITRAIIDHRNIESVISNPFDVYERPKIFRQDGPVMGLKIAEIIKPEYIEHFRFFETVCHNQGYEVSIFQEKDKALEWLLL